MMRRRNPSTRTGVLLALIGILLCAGMAYSQGSNEQGVKNSLVSGAWALQFQVSNDFDLNSFNGSTFSLKKQTSPGRAWRLGLSLSLLVEDSDRLQTSDDEQRPLDADQNSETVELITQRVFYPDPGARVNFYYGLGPRGYYRHTSSTQNSATTDSTTQETVNTQDNWSAGLSGAVGVEWFVTRSISLSGEYSWLVSYNYSKSRSERTSTFPGETHFVATENKTRGASFGSNVVKLGLSMYF